MRKSCFENTHKSRVDLSDQGEVVLLGLQVEMVEEQGVEQDSLSWFVSVFFVFSYCFTLTLGKVIEGHINPVEFLIFSEWKRLIAVFFTRISWIRIFTFFEGMLLLRRKVWGRFSKNLFLELKISLLTLFSDVFFVNYAEGF